MGNFGGGWQKSSMHHFVIESFLITAQLQVLLNSEKKWINQELENLRIERWENVSHFISTGEKQKKILKKKNTC